MISADGRYVAILLNDGAADVQTIEGETLGLIRGHDAPLAAAHFSPDGEILITIDDAGSVRRTRLEGLFFRERGHGADMSAAVEQAVWGDALAAPAALLWETSAIHAPWKASSQIMDADTRAPVLPKGAVPPPRSMFRDCADCPEMLVVPPGAFLMGSPEDEEGRDPDEGPQRDVRIDYPFAAARFETTLAEFQRFMKETGHAPAGGCVADSNGDGLLSDEPEANWSNTGFEQSDAQPAACVSWNDAQAYVHWLSRKTGETYRLLSEAEWEYAARAGTTSAYFWGSSADAGCAYMNGADATAKRSYPGWTTVSCDDGYLNTSPVGSFNANAFGLYDMTGNVSEWTEDCWNESYSGAPINGSAWISGECSRRVLRGGSWSGYPRSLRSALRGWNSTSDRYDHVGFRVARTL
ncbi:MAG: formylglycine-generating enzyme family protein [Pseudomonadota bacterium]